MSADRVAAAHYLLDHFRIGCRHAANGKERRLGAVGRESFEDRPRVRPERAVVEGQNDLSRL